MLPLYGIDSAAGMYGCGRGLGGHGLRLGFFRIVALALALKVGDHGLGVDTCGTVNFTALTTQQ